MNENCNGYFYESDRNQKFIILFLVGVMHSILPQIHDVTSFYLPYFIVESLWFLENVVMGLIKSHPKGSYNTSRKSEYTELIFYSLQFSGIIIITPHPSIVYLQNLKII